MEVLRWDAGARPATRRNTPTIPQLPGFGAAPLLMDHDHPRNASLTSKVGAPRRLAKHGVTKHAPEGRFSRKGVSPKVELEQLQFLTNSFAISALVVFGSGAHHSYAYHVGTPTVGVNFKRHDGSA